MNNFLNPEQIKTLDEKEWDVRPKGFYVTIYPDDFDSSAWKQICEQAGVDTDSKELTVLSFGVKTN